MTAENQKLYDQRLKRLNDALDLKEPDMVPIDVEGGKFMINYAGYKMKDAIYDTSLEVYKDSVKKFMKDFNPDQISISAANFFGEGPGYEATGTKNMFIAGMKENPIDEDSLHQHVEYPTLMDDEFEEFLTDQTGWRIKKYFPRVASIFDGWKDLDLSFDHRAAINTALALSKPEVKETIQKLWEVGEFYQKQRKAFADAVKEFAELGYPNLAGTGGIVSPFDNYSDNYRGTILSLEDLYVNPEVIEAYTNNFHKIQLEKIRNMNKDGRFTGKYVSTMLHKGIDGFMNDECYAHFYWPHLYEIMEEEIKAGMIPMMFCEGKYNTRLKYLKQSPAGRKLFRFETIDMKLAKQELKGVACIGGAFPSTLLQFGTKEQVREEVKRFLEDAMPGGGYIFRTSASIDAAKVENVEVMFETVREYGKY